MRRLHISAGGTNTRLKDFISKNYGTLPKHLLPIPAPEGNLLGQIMRDAEMYFSRMTVWVGKHNIREFLPLVPRYQSATYVADQYMTGPLGPLVRHTLQHKVRSYGCAGDLYCKFEWGVMEQFHEQHGCPITILLAPSVPVTDAAVFDCADSGKVVDWSRRDSHDGDLINIGAYIIDPTPEVLQMLEGLDSHKEDSFNDAAIRRGLMAGYVPGSIGFNVNTYTSYEQLLLHLEG